jgi:hypothetical protein
MERELEIANKLNLSMRLKINEEYKQIYLANILWQYKATWIELVGPPNQYHVVEEAT